MIPISIRANAEDSKTAEARVALAGKVTVAEEGIVHTDRAGVDPTVARDGEEGPEGVTSGRRSCSCSRKNPATATA